MPTVVRCSGGRVARSVCSTWEVAADTAAATACEFMTGLS